MNIKTISLPELKGLNPTLEGTMIKLQEECGELAREVGKKRKLSGESKEEENIDAIIEEMLDVAQTTVTMMFVLERMYGIDVNEAVKTHIEKLERKGYIK